MTAPPDRSAPPPWHPRLAEKLREIGRDPALAAACRRGRSTEPFTDLDMSGPLIYVLEGDETTEPGDYVPRWQREAVAVATHHVLALYACHIQSKDASMHRYGVSLGTAVRQLQAAMPSKDGAANRLRAALNSDTVSELAEHLRFLTSLMRTYAITLDYVALADALARWEHPDQCTRLRMRWNMDFRRTPPKTSADPAVPQE